MLNYIHQHQDRRGESGGRGGGAKAGGEGGVWEAGQAGGRGGGKEEGAGSKGYQH